MAWVKQSSTAWSSAGNKKKKYPKIQMGYLYLQTTNNNSIVTLTDHSGNAIVSAGTGRVGFKGTKESSSYAAEQAAKFVLTEAKNHCGMKEVGIICRWVGLGRDGVFKAVNEIWAIDILWIKEDTPLRFGGTKGKRLKRN